MANGELAVIPDTIAGLIQLHWQIKFIRNLTHTRALLPTDQNQPPPMKIGALKEGDRDSPFPYLPDINLEEVWI